MKILPLSIDGAYQVIPVLHGDPRGLFGEFYRHDKLTEAVGHPLRLAQGNLSVSARGVVRGIHFADVPPSQAKYVQCVRGAVLDVIVDLRVGSPTFGRWEGVRLDDVDRHAVYIAEGLGHGFCALTDDATLAYLCSETYSPTREHAVHPLDPDLGIEWPADVPQLSARDAAAPSLAEAIDSGLLPNYRDCVDFYASLRVTEQQ
ncbi:dTDP-4-dehydrorhamnose 3,5-epimerase family protein [Planosporangium mesophilum]|uniref:dTDP-4-dehydrorhamnose 3,5-epimerase n=1 Tax=Planosporangium mesophilum TaxID=689768 RepID=A0A8J3T9L2_9ACTN|nr:dTDP-4-dehydrorhamnose 3,5-epimerase family protein [Planosporangium mesophilum]NJC82205.1 dTDP-4-keto-6-deoxy-D-glucose epimerase [Planosporangium mesophilum]GII22254.1 dTDP-4-dehydrorhamnose 3,5-epimerase [Planosporangium mesophilum]